MSLYNLRKPSLKDKIEGQRILAQAEEVRVSKEKEDEKVELKELKSSQKN